MAAELLEARVIFQTKSKQARIPKTWSAQAATSEAEDKRPADQNSAETFWPKDSRAKAGAKLLRSVSTEEFTTETRNTQTHFLSNPSNSEQQGALSLNNKANGRRATEQPCLFLPTGRAGLPAPSGVTS